jgi:hypothetical protein
VKTEVATELDESKYKTVEELVDAIKSKAAARRLGEMVAASQPATQPSTP